ncbi:MAG: universal stress protein [Desulfobacterales bacterium]|nr:universal stress protein [Desulfobacterales bacterium]
MGQAGKRTLFKRAVDLAKNNRAHLTVVDIVEKLPREMQRLITSFHLADIQNHVVEERLKDLKQNIALMAPGSRVTTKVLVGTPFLEVIREVLKNKHDLVMKTARGGNRLKEMLFGSTAMHLMRKCPCPVWVIKPTHRRKYTRIMAAVAPDPIDKKRDNLNVKIMELATSLAQMENSELHVVHAWEFLPSFRRISKIEVDKLVRKLRSEHKGSPQRTYRRNMLHICQRTGFIC